MCGGYRLELGLDDLVDALGVHRTQLDLPWAPELFPGQSGPVVLDRRSKQPTAGLERHLGLLRWGLVPAWADRPPVGSSDAKLYNARVETVSQKPSFKAAYVRRRCLVPVSAFFEWSGPQGSRTRHAIRHPDAPFLTLAGLWEVWMGSDGARLGSYTIVTTEANASVRPIHHRMPLLVPPSQRDPWLSLGPLATSSLAELRQATAEMPLVIDPNGLVGELAASPKDR